MGLLLLTNTGANYVPVSIWKCITVHKKSQCTSTTYYLYYMCTNTDRKIILTNSTNLGCNFKTEKLKCVSLPCLWYSCSYVQT